MLKMIVTHPNDRIDTNIVEDLAEIDLTKDAVICCSYSKTLNQLGKQEVIFDVDEFLSYTMEILRPEKHPKKIIYKYYPRIKITLPIGLFPQFECVLPGLQINGLKTKKSLGVEFEQELTISDKIINIKGEKGRYAFYDPPTFEFIETDHVRFSTENKFIGFRIPAGETILSLRLLHQFIGQHANYDNIYLICNSYIYERLPNF